ncbi:hypothetical protein EFO91_10270 [Lactiplantibacillus plantarum]|uniref:hypothetical protein n=1 Tax=Lactiplantibacillus plantarum TaxID=1590 RepID=UPI0015910CAE|nr:hypothetical protein [Lactiplantibacillus plantarum]MCT3226029.1 hypothetical protein [Lactiplantibacillus plantarum]MCT3272376.1 hypothetical protein [Lactiplantibacillus plantarum]QKX11519.1 hypothetical protein Heal19_502913 [Lactiplantibacillus plantarum]
MKFFKRHIFGIIFALLVLSIVVNIMLCVYLKDSNLYKEYLFDKDGKFNWTVVTVVVAAISFIAAEFDKNRQFRADLVSKSRIEWIQKVREATVNVESSFQYLYITAHADPKAGTYNVELENATIKYQAALNILILYFSTDKDIDTKFNIKNELKTIPAPNNIRDFGHCEIRDQRKKVKKEADRLKKVKIDNESALSPLINRARSSNKNMNGLIINFLNSLYETAKEISFRDGNDTKYQYGKMKDDNSRLIKKYVEKLVSIIAIYLKIEWDRAKIGE